MKKLIIVFFLAPLFVFAQSAGSRVYIETSPSTIIAGSIWTLKIIVDYSDADKVDIILPPITGSLSLVRVLKSPRATISKRETVYEYSFTAARSGRHVLESFTIVTPEGITETERIVLNVQGIEAEINQVVYKTAWENIPARINAGEHATLILRCNEWSASEPKPEFFMPDVPPGAILSSLPLSQEERSKGVLIKLRFIPIEGNFNLAPRVFQLENNLFEIPAVFIRVEGSIEPVQTSFPEVSSQVSADLYTDPLLKTSLDELEKARVRNIVFIFICFVIILVIFILFVCLLFKQRKN